MTVDVATAVVIDRSREQVAAFAGDPDNTVRWYANISSVAWQTPRPRASGRASRSWRGANRKDLRRLKMLLEQGGQRGG